MRKILLVDDDQPTNVLHEIILKKFTSVPLTIKTFLNGKQALDYLKEAPGQYIIFLDINMPTMSGWDFLDASHNIEGHDGTRIFILTSSINPEDEQKAAKYPEVNGFEIKPLSVDFLKKHVGELFT
jgi:CheY-like chemotaxis protein